MEGKKISFGFCKITKKNEIVSNFSKSLQTPKQVELIDCLEDRSIKVKDVVEETKGPLIIPIQSSTKNLIDRVKEAKERRIKNEIKQEELPDSALSIDELAARELIREAKVRDIVKTETKIMTLPIKEDKFVPEGGEEASLEDYDSVPVSDYGLAMLRGMGWKEGMPIGKTQAKSVTPILPELRPKGLGLGANKMVNANKPKPVVDKQGKELQLIKGASAKIIAGNHKGHYCQVEGLDDENCTIIVKTSITGEILNLNEFLIVPVTNEEYSLGSKIINNAKYEEYKEKSREKRDNGEKSRTGRGRSRSRDKCRRKKSPKEPLRSDHDIESSDSSKRRSHEKRKSKHHKSKHHRKEKKTKDRREEK